jgi:hypothetical protein
MVIDSDGLKYGLKPLMPSVHPRIVLFEISVLFPLLIQKVKAVYIWVKRLFEKQMRKIEDHDGIQSFESAIFELVITNSTSVNKP